MYRETFYVRLSNRYRKRSEVVLKLIEQKLERIFTNDDDDQ